MTYGEYIRAFQELYLSARGAKEPLLDPLQKIYEEALKRILIIAPHPDDECLMAGLAIRAQEEWGTEVFVLPFSYGSKLERQSARKRELMKALDLLGFTLTDPRSPSFRELLAPEIEEVLMSVNPDAIFIPHSHDGHLAHVRCAKESMIAIKNFSKSNSIVQNVFETEFWQGMEKPNLLVPLSAHHLTKLGEALKMHQGEVERNPYHLTLPAYFMEQKRRGTEAVGGVGVSSDDSIFAQMYRISKI